MRFLHGRPFIHGPKNFKNGVNTEIFLESCKETSKLSRDVYWSRWDHIVAQKSNLKIFSSKMTLTHVTPPDYLPA